MRSSLQKSSNKTGFRHSVQKHAILRYTRIKHTIPPIKYAAVMLLLRSQSHDTLLSANVILCLTLRTWRLRYVADAPGLQRACANREDCAGAFAQLTASNSLHL